MSSATLLSLLAIAVSSGAAYALFALGYSLVYSVLGLMNMAHGDVMMTATYLSLAAWEVTRSVPLAIGAGLVGGAAVGAAVDQVAYRPLRFTGDTIAPLVTGLGAAFLLRNAITSAFGPLDRDYPSLIPAGSVKAGTTMIPVGSFVIIAAALLAACGIRLLLERTRAGWVVQAISQDVTAARLTGLPVGSALLATYAVAGAAAAIGGILYSSAFGTLNDQMGWNATTIAFTAAVLGGLGSLRGSVLGGLALGVADTFVAYLLPDEYEQAVSFGLLVLVLLIRPARDRRPLSVPARA
jgi:branched-chain amino acid transport system permease protein